MKPPGSAAQLRFLPSAQNILKETETNSFSQANKNKAACSRWGAACRPNSRLLCQEIRGLHGGSTATERWAQRQRHRGWGSNPEQRGIRENHGRCRQRRNVIRGLQTQPSSLKRNRKCHTQANPPALLATWPGKGCPWASYIMLI